MGLQLEGRTALVTGAGQGVGQGIARALAAAGADLITARRPIEKAQRVAAYLRETFGVQVFAQAADVAEAGAVDAMVALAVQQLGRLGILVNDAGDSIARQLKHHTDVDIARGLYLSYWPADCAMRAAFPVMKAQKYGRIINLGFFNGVNAHMSTAAYDASKQAIRALARTAAVEWGPHGITCNVIYPSARSTQAKDYFDANPAMAATILSQVPLGRFGDAKRDVGPVAVFLERDAKKWVPVFRKESRVNKDS